MTTKLDTLLDTLEKLDAARTPGEWNGVRLEFANSWAVSTPGSLLCKVFGGKKDTDFIVACVNSNAKLRQIIRVQREALEFYSLDHRDADFLAYRDGEVVVDRKVINATEDDFKSDQVFGNGNKRIKFGKMARQAISQVENILEGI